MRDENDEEAARFLLKYWAPEIVEGRVDLLSGARLMNRSGWFPLEQPAELNELVYLLDAWDDMPQRREKIDFEILELSRES